MTAAFWAPPWSVLRVSVAVYSPFSAKEKLRKAMAVPENTSVPSASVMVSWLLKPEGVTLSAGRLVSTT